MSSFNRRILILSLAAFAGCGFTPAYGPSGPARKLQGLIDVDAPDDRNSFDFVRRLEERLGHAEAPQYRLAYTLSLSEDDLAITPAQEITRYNVLGAARFTLQNIGTGEIVTSGMVDSFTSYSATGTTVSTLTAQRAAYARLMIILADQITTRLIGTSGVWMK